MSSSYQYVLAASHRSRHYVKHWKHAELRGLERDVAISLVIHLDGNAAGVGISTLCSHADDAAGTLQFQIHYHFLAHRNSHDLIAIRMTVTVEEMKSLAHPYLFDIGKKGLSMVADVYYAGVYSWDSHAMTHIAQRSPQDVLVLFCPAAGQRTLVCREQ